MGLTEFLRLKNELLDFELTTKDDIKEVELWPETIKHEVVKKLIKNLINAYEGSAAGRFCPWCILKHIKEKTCEECLYGKRNRLCSSTKSRYMQYIGYKKTSITTVMLNNKEKLLVALKQ